MFFFFFFGYGWCNTNTEMGFVLCFLWVGLGRHFLGWAGLGWFLLWLCLFYFIFLILILCLYIYIYIVFFNYLSYTPYLAGSAAYLDGLIALHLLALLLLALFSSFIITV